MKLQSESEKKGRVRGLRRTPMFRLAEFFLALFGGLGVMKKIFARAQGSDASRRSGSAMGITVGNRAPETHWRKGWDAHLGTKMPIIFEGRGAVASIKNAPCSRIQLNENDLCEVCGGVGPEAVSGQGYGVMILSISIKFRRTRDARRLGVGAEVS